MGDNRPEELYTSSNTLLALGKINGLKSLSASPLNSLKIYDQGKTVCNNMKRVRPFSIVLA
jgi:hypothetical protein